MKPLPAIAILSFFTSFSLCGQEDNKKFLGFVDQIRFKGQTMMNVGLKFGMKSLTATGTDSPTLDASSYDHAYINGFVNLDAQGQQALDNGQTPVWTSFWQYETTDQIVQYSDPWPAPLNGILQFNSFEPVQEISYDDTMDPITGGEIEFRKVFSDNGKRRWGADFAVGFLTSSQTIDDTLQLRWTVDTYVHPFDAATMPGPNDPQQTYLQDNNKIQNTPTRNVSTVSGQATRNFDTQMTTFRLGAFYN